MTDIKVYGELLASEDDRTLKYRLLPFGSIGRTNVGAVIASESSVEIPEDISHLTLNTEHNQMTPVGRFVNIEKAKDALYASVQISKFKRGDDALNLTASGELTGISVEIAGAVIQSGKLVGGELVGAALCKKPAFPEAILMASDSGDVEEALDALSEAVEGVKTALAQPSEAPAEEEIPEETETPEETLDPFLEEEEKKKGLTAMENSVVPTALTASNGGSATVKTFEQGVALIASAAKSRDKVLIEAINEAGIAGERNLFAALSTVTSNPGPGDNLSQPAWLGEAWTGKQYQRKYAPLVSSASLTNWNMTGWRFVQRPTVGDYAGFPTQVPTGPVTTEQFTVEASRIAGGNSIDLKYKHFGDTEFLNAFYRAQIEEYARVSDARVIAHVKTGATATVAGEVPTGVSATAAAIVDGALAMIDFATPSAALVPVAMYRELLLSREDDSLKYLQSALGLEDGTFAGFGIIPSTDVTAVHVLAKEAVTLYELAGAPIRVEVDTPSNGGFDTAIFGYTALNTNDARGIIRVDPPAPAV